MFTYSVNLRVEMEADSPQEAAEKVAELAGGWTYSVKDVSNDNAITEVHLEDGADMDADKPCWCGSYPGDPHNNEAHLAEMRYEADPYDA